MASEDFICKNTDVTEDGIYTHFLYKHSTGALTETFASVHADEAEQRLKAFAKKSVFEINTLTFVTKISDAIDDFREINKGNYPEIILMHPKDYNNIEWFFDVLHKGTKVGFSKSKRTVLFTKVIRTEDVKEGNFKLY